MKRPRSTAPFLSRNNNRTLADDNPAEAEAAMQANVQSIVVDRPGNAPLSEESKARFHVIQQLTDLP
jgi:enolase-phosphatase E1